MKYIFSLSFALGIGLSSISFAGQQVTLKVVPGKSTTRSINDQDDLINADFPEPTDVRDIAKAFSLWTGKPFEVADSVHSKVKLESPEKISKGEAEKRFRTMLKAYGLKTIDADGKILIVKAEKNCGPVPPGGTMDSDCNLGVAPPPPGYSQ